MIVEESLSGVGTLTPGAHVVLLSSDPMGGLQGRRMALELRDTLLILSPQGMRFAFLFRKEPEGTVAENVLKYGVGGLNIDGCRIGTQESLNGGAYVGELRGKTTEWQNADRSDGKGSGFRQGIGAYQQPTGRWPSNLVLIHGPGCHQEGTKKVASQNPSYASEDKGQIRYHGGNQRGRAAGVSIGYASEDGTETVTNWVCVSGCPVAALDEQSGTLMSGTKSPHHARNVPRLGHGGTYGNDAGTQPPRTWQGDSGGASRFFPQFGGEAELHDWLRRLLGL